MIHKRRSIVGCLTRCAIIWTIEFETLPGDFDLFGRRKKTLRLELKKRFEVIRAMEDLDPSQFRELETRKSFRQAEEKITVSYTHLRAHET